MTEFIIGGSGSGKSDLICDRIVNDLSDGKKVILLVPEQNAILAEAMISEAADAARVPQSELEVLNFKRLANRVFRQFGGIAYNSINGGAKALVLWKALFSSVPFLRRYKNEVSDAKRFIPTLLCAISELQSFAVTPAELQRAAKEARDQDPSLSNKLFDLSLIFAQYESISKNSYSDPSEDLTRLCTLLSEHDFFSGISLYIDSFSGFTPVEYSVLSLAFKQARDVTVSLTLNDDKENFAFDNIRDTYKRLLQLMSRRKEDITRTVLSEFKRSSSAALSHLERELWRLGECIPFYGECPEIRTVCASDIYAEAEFAANDIISKLEKGAKYSDFAVIVRNTDSYRGIIDAVFERCSLPCHLSLRNELCEKPLFKLIISAFNIFIGGWNNEDIMVYMKTGLCPISPDECDELETYAYQWGIFGKKWYDEQDWFMNPDGYTDRFTEKTQMKLTRINATRKKLVSPLLKLSESFDGSRTVKELCTVLYDFLSEISADKTIASSEDIDSIRIWNCLCDALDTLASTLGDVKADADLFINLFSLVADQTNIGNLPRTVDEITVGSADKIRTDGIKHVYVLGVNEGIFPATATENGLFSDNDKAALEAYGIILSPDSEAMSINELFIFYTSLCCASQSVTAVYSSSDSSGEAIEPSFALLRIKALFPNAEHIRTDTLPEHEFARNKESAFPLAFISKDPELKEALRRIYSADPEYSFFFDNDRQKLYSQDEKIEKETAKMLFGDDIALTQSRLDQFVYCKFGYHCKYAVKLEEKRKYRFRSVDNGNLVHNVLEKFFSSAIDENGRVKELSRDEIIPLFDEVLGEYLNGIYGTGAKKIGEKELRLFSKLKKNIILIIENIVEEFRCSEFVPKFFEMRIDSPENGGKVSPLKIPLSDGGHAFIYGIADRVDICQRGKDAYVRVVDYKTGKKDFSLKNIRLGLDLQMLLYLFSIWKDADGRFKKELGITGDIIPSGVLYHQVKFSSVDISPTDDEEAVKGKIFSDVFRRRGMVLADRDVLELMEKNLSGKYIPVKFNKDGTFSKYSSIYTLDELGQQLDEIIDTVKKLGDLMKNGDASAVPMRENDHDPCKYCPHKVICRNPIALSSADNQDEEGDAEQNG